MNERYYYVDEAGDLTLFNKRGRVLVGTEGCSRHFILGVVLIDDPHQARKKIELLRQDFLADEYLRNVPSILRKTAIAFHAKDDCPEVRREVYKLISTLSIKVYGIVRRKSYLVESVKQQNSFDTSWRYDANKIYDSCVKRLFKDRLHQADVNHITFARRGKSARNKALTEELQKARRNFEKSIGRSVSTQSHVASNYPSNEPCLQIIDYALWALQRLYEKHEERYFEFIRDKFVRIIDLDDKREKGYGVYYDKRNKLTVDKIKDSLKG